MGEWRSISLRDLAANDAGAIAIGPFGSAMRADTYSESGVPVIRGTNISVSRAWKGDWVFIPEEFADSMPRCVALPNDIVFPHRGSIGEVAIVPSDRERYFLSSSLMKISVDVDKADSLFVYYYFRSNEGRDEILKYSSQVGTPGIGQPLNSLKQFRVPFPPLNVQQRISGLFGALDDKIEMNRRMNETLEATARAIFKDWFVDFGPTRAKLEGGAPYLAQDIWALFPDRVDAEGKPDGWQSGSLVDFSELNPESWSRRNYPDHIRYVDLSNTKWGTIESTEVHDRETAPSRAQRILRPGDTIVGTVRPGNGSYAFVSEQGLTGSTGFAVLRPRHSRFREIVYIVATSPENIDRLSHLADGGAYPAVRPEVVAQTEILGFADKLIARFSEITGPLFDQAEANKREARSLAQTRDLLLPKLMSGKIRLRDAEKLVEAAA